MKKISFALWLLFFPLVVLAEEATNADVTLLNPLGEGANIYVLIARVIRVLLQLSGAIALFMFVLGGFVWLTSRGVPAKIEEGKKTIIWATYGIVFILVAYTLLNALIDALLTGNVLGTQT